MNDWKTLVREDREAVLARDPAAKSMAEVRLCYPGLVALNAAWAQFHDGTPILMGPEEIALVAEHAPQALVIATHMDAVNHARLDRAGLRSFVKSRGLEARFVIPEDGEIVNL